MFDHPLAARRQAIPMRPGDVLGVVASKVRGGVDTKCPIKRSKKWFIGRGLPANPAFGQSPVRSILANHLLKHRVSVKTCFLPVMIGLEKRKRSETLSL
jgi:hypothetical protein